MNEVMVTLKFNWGRVNHTIVLEKTHAGVVLADGSVQKFDTIEDAIKAIRKDELNKPPKLRFEDLFDFLKGLCPERNQKYVMSNPFRAYGDSFTMKVDEALKLSQKESIEYAFSAEGDFHKRVICPIMEVAKEKGGDVFEYLVPLYQKGAEEWEKTRKEMERTSSSYVGSSWDGYMGTFY